MYNEWKFSTCETYYKSSKLETNILSNFPKELIFLLSVIILSLINLILSLYFIN